VPLFTLHVFDSVMETRNGDTLIYLSVLFLIAISLGAVLRSLRNTLLLRLAEWIERRLLLRTGNAALQLGLAGQLPLVGMVLKDFSSLRRFFRGSLPGDLLDLFTSPVALIFTYMIHPAYAALAVVTAVILGLFGWLTDRSSKPSLIESSTFSAQASSSLTQQLRRADELNGLGMLPAVLRRWRPVQARALGAQEAAERRAKGLRSLSGVVANISRAAVFMLGAWLVIHNQASPGSIIAASMLIGMVLAPFESMSRDWFSWTMARVSYGRLRQLSGMLAPETAPDAAQPDAAPGLIVAGLSVVLPGEGRILVRSLDLRLNPGSVLVVTGPNGVGKSTLLRCLIGLHPAGGGGTALLDGRDLHRTSRDEIGPHIGLLGQRPQLLEGTVMENISRFTGDAAAAVVAARLAGAHDMIGRLPRGYAAQVGAASGLSGGQQRQIALARALFGQPRLVALDEPEAALDAPALAALRATVNDLRELGCVVVLVTHDRDRWDGIAEQELCLARDGTWLLSPLGQKALESA
jgi:ATP-binding cassette subfamily C protein